MLSKVVMVVHPLESVMALKERPEEVLVATSRGGILRDKRLHYDSPFGDDLTLVHFQLYEMAAEK